MVRFAVRALLGLVVLQLVFTALLVVAQAVPNGPAVRHLDEAVRSGDFGAPYAPDGVGGTADRFTECVVLGHGVSSADDDRSLWFRATGGVRLSSCEDGVGEVERLAAGESLVPPATYFRYWSGYAVLTRPVLALTDVPGLRLVVAGVFALAALAAFWTLARRAGPWAAGALLLPVAATTNALAMPSTAFTHGIALAAVAGGVALTAVAADRGWRGAAVGAGASAAVFCFVDLLTVPPMAWATSAAVAGAVVHARRGRLPATLRAVLAAGAAWPVAFGVTWVSRWLVAAAVQGPDVFSRISEVSRFRIDGGDVSKEFGAGVVANWDWWTQHSATAVPVLVAAGAVALVGLVVALRRHGVAGLAAAAVLALPALVVPAWYCVLSNHSQIHAFFTYRSLAAAVGVVLLAVLVAARPARPVAPLPDPASPAPR